VPDDNGTTCGLVLETRCRPKYGWHDLRQFNAIWLSDKILARAVCAHLTAINLQIGAQMRHTLYSSDLIRSNKPLQAKDDSCARQETVQVSIDPLKQEGTREYRPMECRNCFGIQCDAPILIGFCST
jgi:hypothetical protein